MFWIITFNKVQKPSVNPANTLRNNDVVITSKRRHFDLIASKWRRFDFITTLLQRHVLDGKGDMPNRNCQSIRIRVPAWLNPHNCERAWEVNISDTGALKYVNKHALKNTATCAMAFNAVH